MAKIEWHNETCYLDEYWVQGIQYGRSCPFLLWTYNPVIPLSCSGPGLAVPKKKTG